MAKLLFGLTCMFLTVSQQSYVEFSSTITEILAFVASFVGNGGPTRLM